MNNYIIIHLCFTLYKYSPAIYNSYKIYLLFCFIYKKLKRNKVKYSDDWEMVENCTEIEHLKTDSNSLK